MVGLAWIRGGGGGIERGVFPSSFPIVRPGLASYTHGNQSRRPTVDFPDFLIYIYRPEVGIHVSRREPEMGSGTLDQGVIIQAASGTVKLHNFFYNQLDIGFF